MLVLCEVFNPDGTPHETNTRAKLEALIDDKVRAEKPWYGFEQVRAAWTMPASTYTYMDLLSCGNGSCKSAGPQCSLS